MPEQHGIQENEWGGLTCLHRDTAIRLRTRKNGVRCFCLQCLTCGSSLREYSKHAPEVMQLAHIDPFDAALKERWRIRSEQHWMARRHAAEEQRIEQDEDQRQQYHAYLKSPAWHRKRALVLDRAPLGLCEGCGVALATQAHHLTYEHVGNEFLWELRAVCRSCHRRFHGIERDDEHE